jgi:23S rRNA (pseudouridine1915-N3)-methyltransferase
MKIELIAAGTKPPGWVREGFDTYRGRMKGDCELLLKEYPIAKRHKTGSIAKYAKEEERAIRDLIHPRALVIALDKSGKLLATEMLANEMSGWMNDYPLIQMLIGGPDGLSADLMRDVNRSISVSPMTFPHFMMRVLIAEQLYRAWSINRMHPYHK